MEEGGVDGEGGQEELEESADGETDSGDSPAPSPGSQRVTREGDAENENETENENESEKENADKDDQDQEGQVVDGDAGGNEDDDDSTIDDDNDDDGVDSEDPEVELEDAPDATASSGSRESGDAEFQMVAATRPISTTSNSELGNFTLRQSDHQRPQSSSLKTSKAKQRRKYQLLSQRRIKLRESLVAAEAAEASRRNKSSPIMGTSSSSVFTGTRSAARSGGSSGNGDETILRVVAKPQLASRYSGKVRENERYVQLAPKLVILNGVEVCDIELRNGNGNGGNSFNNNSNNDGNEHNLELPFVISWINRVTGEATLEARSERSMNCERQQNFTFSMRAIGCNGLVSEE